MTERVDYAGWANKAREQDLMPRDGESNADWSARMQLAVEAQLRREAQAKAAEELKKRPDETSEQWAARIEKWRAEHAEEVAASAPAGTVQQRAKPPVKSEDLYDEAARAQLLADVRAGKAVAPTVVDETAADPNYTEAGRARLIEQARQAAARAETTHRNTPRG